MPILLLQSNHQKTIYILNERESVVFQSEHSGKGMITNIRDCLSSDLAGLNVYAEGRCIETPWPFDNHIFSEALIQKIAPCVALEQMDIINQDITLQDIENSNKCLRTFIPICKDREFIVMFLRKGHEQDLLFHLHNPNQIYHWGIPSVPICHVPMVYFDLAISECLHENANITWQPSVAGTYQRVIKSMEDKLTWLGTPDDCYFNLILPFLSMLGTLHERQVNHGDITDDNVVMSEDRQQLFFIDDEVDRDQNDVDYYFWHMERLYDLACLSYAITNLADRYFPNIKKTDCIIQYFSQLGAALEEVCDERDSYWDDNNEFELDINCIERHMHLTVTNVAARVRQLHTTRIAILKSSDSVVKVGETNADACDPKKLVRKFSIYCEEKGTEAMSEAEIKKQAVASKPAWPL